MKFSERKGYVEVRRIIQKEEINEELRNSLWNTLDTSIWQTLGFVESYYDYDRRRGPYIKKFSQALWSEYFKLPADERPSQGTMILQKIRQYFFNFDWYEVYDLLEWILNNRRSDNLTTQVNNVLERELSAYRFVGGQFTDITDEQEIASLEQALSDNDFPGVKVHLQTALKLLSNRESPDYRNSIKESISAVESMAKTLTGNPKATLGEALKTLENQGELHKALKNGFSQLYGYTSDEGGVRHAMIKEPNLDAADAKFFLLSCTSFINYLKSKM